MTDLPKCLFHYRFKLRQYANDIDDIEATKHVYFTLRYMEQILLTSSWTGTMVPRTDATEERANGPSPSKHMPGLQLENLWMAFRPGCLIYLLEDGKENVYRLRNMTQRILRNSFLLPSPSWNLDLLTINYNGKSFGYSTKHLSIYPYEGHVPFTKLRAFPLEYREKKNEIMQRMVARGKKFVTL